MICVYLYGNGTSARRIFVYFCISLCISTHYHWSLHQTDCWILFFSLWFCYSVISCKKPKFIFFCYFYMNRHIVKDFFLWRYNKNVEMLWIAKHRGNISFYHSKINQTVESSESITIKVLFLSLHLPYTLPFSVLQITHLTNMGAYKALRQLHLHQLFTQINGKKKKKPSPFIRSHMSQ